MFHAENGHFPDFNQSAHLSLTDLDVNYRPVSPRHIIEYPIKDNVQTEKTYCENWSPVEKTLIKTV